MGVGVLLVITSCVGLDAGNRSAFAALTYGAEADAERVVPKPALDFQLYAALQAEVLGPWKDPAAAARCLKSLTTADLRRIGQQLDSKPDPEAWALAAWTATASLRTRDACSAGFATDPAQLAWAIGKVAGTSADFARLSWSMPPPGRPDTRRNETYEAAVQALASHAEVLRQTPAVTLDRVDRPVLALGGGAANGAFSAGVLYELLSARELALDSADDATRTRWAHSSTFSAVVGTSVGALLAQLLEFTDLEAQPWSAAQQQFLDACAAYEVRHGPSAEGPSSCFRGYPTARWPSAPPPRRAVAACALKLLERYFADEDETTLMCAEPGSVARVVGFLGKPRVNFIRFDPLQRDVLDPLFQAFSTPMMENRLTRVVMSVETRQNQLVGLDERACDPRKGAACLTSGLVASFVLPLFARPVSHTWSGFAGRRGECGIWFDGGLRSQLPSAYALALSRPTPLLPEPSPERPRPLRVLSVDNGRLTPMPAALPQRITDVAFNGLGQLTHQQAVAELVSAQAAALQRDLEMAALLEVSSDAGPAPMPSAADAGTLEAPGDGAPIVMSIQARADLHARVARRTPGSGDTRVRGLYVPGDVQDWVVVGTGYSFDPVVMRGLFLAGRRAVRERMKGDLLDALQWDVGLIASVKQFLQARDADPDEAAWVAAYQQPVCEDFERARKRAGSARIDTRMELCREVPAVATPETGVPAYFSCPAGAWKGVEP
jgi:hypothetical protein